MKIVLIVCALLGLAHAAPTRTLQEDFLDFLELIPRDDIRPIVHRYLDTDEGFQSLIFYLQGPEWAKLVAEVADIQAWIDFKAHMLKAGVDVDVILKFINDKIQNAKPNPSGKVAVQAWIDFKAHMSKAGVNVDSILKFFNDKIQNATPNPSNKVAVRGVREFLDEVLSIIPFDDLLALLDDKLQNSPEFQEFYGGISDDETRGFVEAVRALPEIQRIAVALRGYGIDLAKFLEFVYGVLGWN